MGLCTRRQCVAALAVALGAVLTGFSRLGGGAPVGLLTQDLAQIFRGNRLSAAQAVGREYLRCFPAEADKALLASRICGPGDGDGFRLTRPWLSRQTRQDFEAGRVVELQGWVLSATEARLCALSVLA